MAVLTSNELLAAIRSLPLDERVRVIEQATREIEEDTPRPPVAAAASSRSLVGLFSDDPNLVDEVCNFAYESRDSARMRTPE
jgi:hypothetical protein